MSLKRTLTAVAVDSVTEYLKERIELLKQLDLDKDGQKDVDQLKVLIGQMSLKFTAAIESTDFPKLATGLEQIMSGAGLIGASVDREKLGDACTELGAGLQKVGQLLQLGVQELKHKDSAERN